VKMTLLWRRKLQMRLQQLLMQEPSVGPFEFV